MARRRFTREQYLEAARDFAITEGAGRLTIEGVAKRVGATKGGVLHNFPNKQALLEALLDDLCRQWDMEVEQQMADQDDRPAPMLRGYLRCYETIDHVVPAYADALRIALAEDPALAEPLRASYRKYAEAIEAEAGDVDLARLVWMAAEGIGLLEILGLHRFAPDARTALFGRLAGLAEASASGSTAAESNPA